uniref:Uncharacterized protein n=1 Tax=Arundo donax TaxID=35708 RepID=A0A0A9EC21_ARUDO
MFAVMQGPLSTLLIWCHLIWLARFDRSFLLIVGQCKPKFLVLYASIFYPSSIETVDLFCLVDCLVSFIVFSFCCIMC